MSKKPGLRGGPAGKLPKGPNSKEVPRRHWHNLKYGASKLRYLNAYFSENCQQSLHAFSKIFSNPVQSRKSVKNIGLNWRQIISLAGAHMSRAGPDFKDVGLNIGFSRKDKLSRCSRVYFRCKVLEHEFLRPTQSERKALRSLTNPTVLRITHLNR